MFKSVSQLNIGLIKEMAKVPGGEINPNAGYEYRRLSEVVTTGIYECNDGCKCKERKTCLNRVVQWPIQLRLQVSI